MEKLTVGLREASEMTGISRFTFAKMARLGRIKPVRVGRRVLISVAELQRFAKSGAPSGTRNVEKATRERTK